MIQDTQPTTYQTLEEIEQRKDELRTALQANSKQIGGFWHDLMAT